MLNMGIGFILGMVLGIALVLDVRYIVLTMRALKEANESLYRPIIGDEVIWQGHYNKTKSMLNERLS